MTDETTSIRTCRRCGEDAPGDADRCAYCDERFAYPTVCPSCATPLGGRPLRCATCGYDIYHRSWKATLAPWLVPLVGIVLAHMARSDFRLNPYWRGRTAATVALVLGYTLLTAPVVIALGVLFARWMAGEFS